MRPRFIHDKSLTLAALPACALALLAACSLALAGCSPQSLFGGKDAGVAGMPSYRKVNEACAGMTIASLRLSVAEFRKILHCFNSNGALAPIEKLALRLSDADLKPIVDVGNNYIITNPRLLYQLEQSFYTLTEEKILDRTYAEFGRLLENEEFVSSGIAVLKEGYAAQRDAHGIAGDRAILYSLQKLASRITPPEVADLLDEGLTLARARAFESLQEHLREPEPEDRPGRLGLRELTDQVLQFLQQAGLPSETHLGENLLGEIANGDLFAALDRILGTDPAALPRTVPRSAMVLDTTLADGGRMMDGLTSLVHFTHRPIRCLKGSLELKDGVLHVIDELVKRDPKEAGDFVRRTSLLILDTLAPFCDYAEGLGRSYPSAFQLAGTEAMEPVAELLRALHGITHPDASGTPVPSLEVLLMDIMAATGDAGLAAAGGPPEDTVGVKLLLPTLAELTDRGIWQDTLLLMDLPREQDRREMEEDVRFLTGIIPETGTSIYSAYVNAVARATPTDLYNLVHSLGRFVRSPEPILDPSLTALRQAFYANDVHPIVDLAHNLLADAPSNQPFFNTLFLISETPEFKDSVRLVSTMSRDGRLRELLGGILTIFHKFATQGKSEIRLTQAPPFVPHARHDLSDRDLARPSGPAAPLTDAHTLAVAASCGPIDVRVSLADVLGPGFDGQLGAFAACSDSDGANGDVVSALRLLETAKDERGESYYGLTAKLIEKLDLARDELKVVGDGFVAAFADGSLSQGLAAVKTAILEKVHGASDAPGAAGSALEPLGLVFRPLASAAGHARAALDRLGRYGASLLRREDFAGLLAYADRLSGARNEPEAARPGQYDLARIERWVGNKECGRPEPEGGRAARAREIVDDYAGSVTSWDLGPDGRARRDWDLAGFKDLLDGLLTKFGDPAQGARPGATWDALLDVLRYFTLPAGAAGPNEFQHYPIEELRKFLIDRSDDYRLITYFYPGETQPRVRLVSTMDRLELVLINADLWSPWPFAHAFPNFKNHRNFGLLFLAQIADAWGDEDESVWPEQIRRKFAGTRPPTLAEAVAQLKKTAAGFGKLVGSPRLAGCAQIPDPNDDPDTQRAETHDPHVGGIAPSWMPAFHIPQMQKALYNISQVLPVLDENLPVPGYPLGKGSKMANGMRILRDLFFQLYYSSPEEGMRADFESPADGWKNNLSVVIKLVRAGLTRQSARLLRGTPIDDPLMTELFNALVAGATATDDPLATTPHPRYLVHGILDPLVDPRHERDPSQPRHELFWKVVEQVFAVVDAGEGRALDAAHEAELAGLAPAEAARVREGWALERALMRQMAADALAGADQLGIIRPAIATLGPVLGQYSDFLRDHADEVEGLLRSRRASYFLHALVADGSEPGLKAAFGRALGELLADPQHALDGVGLLEEIVKDPQAKQAATLLTDRWQALSQEQAFQQLDAGPLLRRWLDYFELKGTDPAARSGARKIELSLADRLESGDFDQYLHWGGEDPNGFYRVLEAFGHSIDEGAVDELLREAYDGLTMAGVTPHS